MAWVFGRCKRVQHMRLGVVSSHTIHRDDSTGARRIHRTAEELAARGHDVTIFCTQWWEGYDLTMKRNGLTFRGVTTAPAPASFATRLPFILGRARPDAVYARPVPPGSVLASAAGARLARAPLVVDWYGDEDYRDGPVARRALAAPDCTVAPSELVLSRLRDAGLDGRTDVVPEPIDFDLVGSTSPAGDADVITAGPLGRDANLESLLLALADLEDPLDTTIIGDGPRRSDYEDQASALGLDTVDFVGEISRVERVARYRSARVFVHTAPWAPFATELLWGLACGCVGVVEYQADSAAHELVRGTDRGLLATDDEAVTDALGEAMTYPEQDIDESFADYDYGTVLDRYLELFDRRP